MKRALVLIAGAIACILIGCFLEGVVKEKSVSDKSFQDSLLTINAKYEAQSILHNMVEDSLKIVLHKKDSALTRSNKKYCELKRTGLRLIENAPAECDSLAKSFAGVIKECDSRDSIQEGKILTLKALSSNKDSALKDCNIAFGTLNILASECVRVNLRYQDQLNTAKKKLKAKGLLASGLFLSTAVLSGILLLR